MVDNVSVLILNLNFCIYSYYHHHAKHSNKKETERNLFFYVLHYDERFAIDALRLLLFSYVFSQATSK